MKSPAAGALSHVRELPEGCGGQWPSFSRTERPPSHCFAPKRPHSSLQAACIAQETTNSMSTSLGVLITFPCDPGLSNNYPGLGEATLSVNKGVPKSFYIHVNEARTQHRGVPTLPGQFLESSALSPPWLSLKINRVFFLFLCLHPQPGLMLTVNFETRGQCSF